MDLLVVMDPLDGCDPTSDTSIGMMAAALERRHEVFHCTAGGLSLIEGRVVARVVAVDHGDLIGDRNGDGAGASIGSRQARTVDLAEMDAVLVRSDPPVDSAYLAMTLLLEHARRETFIVNDPRGLREANEKLYACRFPELMPATVVTADAATLLDFADAHGTAVLKPLDGHGGRGVCLLAAGDSDASMVIATMTDNGRHQVMAQEFLPGVYDGDRRILLLDGEPLGALRRRPAKGEFRANIGLGGQVDVVDLDERDQRIVDTLAPALRADGLWFVGIDVIDGRLSEVNVTSPTGLRQLANLSGTRPDLAIIEWLEDRVGRP